MTTDTVTTWLNGIGCRHLFTSSWQSPTSGQAENFIWTLKTFIDSTTASTLDEVQMGVGLCLLQYRSAKHSITKETSSKLWKGRIIRSNMRSLESVDVTYSHGDRCEECQEIYGGNSGCRLFKHTQLMYWSYAIPWTGWVCFSTVNKA